MEWIDLRSDTVTRPTEGMRRAIAAAVVGDDVFGEDPTVLRLEERTAFLLGKEAGLFVASGTMGNLVALLTHAGRGDEIILGDRSHTFLYEAGGCSGLGGIHPHVLPNLDDGTLDLAPSSRRSAILRTSTSPERGRSVSRTPTTVAVAPPCLPNTATPSGRWPSDTASRSTSMARGCLMLRLRGTSSRPSSPGAPIR